VQRLQAQCLEDEQVQRALDDVGVVRCHADILDPLILIVKM
jgi:hypothetical protein